MQKLEGKNLGHGNIRPSYANQSSETEFPLFLGKRPGFRRKRDLYEPPLSAMAQVLPFLKNTKIKNSKNKMVTCNPGRLHGIKERYETTPRGTAKGTLVDLVLSLAETKHEHIITCNFAEFHAEALGFFLANAPCD